MLAGIFNFLFLLGISTFCWIMVLRPSFRRKQNEPASYFWRLKKQGRQDLDALSLASSLVGAIFFSIVTLVFAIVAVYRLLAH